MYLSYLSSTHFTTFLYDNNLRLPRIFLPYEKNFRFLFFLLGYTIKWYFSKICLMHQFIALGNSYIQSLCKIISKFISDL